MVWYDYCNKFSIRSWKHKRIEQLQADPYEAVISGRDTAMAINPGLLPGRYAG